MASADRLIELFSEAKARAIGPERERFLADSCRDEPGLKEQVVSLLQAAERAGEFLTSGAVSLATPIPKEKPSDRIGRYKLLEQIGEGGCGVVYMAEQVEPVRRRVALKVIKLGMDTRSVIARFEAERQTLALMEHPNIAKVFDAGATETGRPYFVMELVRGIKITDYCDQNNLSTAERLKLFTQVCHAIQHAHQKGIIHRDIKPSNILVTVSEPGLPGSPKVIDFGIAKATTDQRLTDKTVFTAFQQFIGTPAYMSPEQAMMTSLDIDTRTDIYALGVLLYELLTGTTPFDVRDLMAAGLDAMRRTIHEQEPARPSTRLRTMIEAELSTVARNRRSEPAKLGSALRGDLDWIVMKALEKDRSRRYETANGLAMDIQRHLSNEPVSARPPSNLYRFQKLARRNRGALLAAGTVFAALLTAVIVLGTSNGRIRTERNQKDTALRERSTALGAAREQLFVSLQSQADARRHSGQVGQRIESLAALAQAARIRPEANLRDNAIATMAIPDIQHGPAWGNAGTQVGAFDAAYQRFARIEPDGAISIRTIPDDKEVQRLEFSPGTTSEYAAFSPDGRHFAALRERGKLFIWRWESGEAVFKSPPEKCSALVFSPDSRRVAAIQGDSIAVFELSTGEAKHHWQTRGKPYAMDFDPASERLAVGYLGSNIVSIYKADTGSEELELPIGGTSGSSVAWHPEGKLLATGDSEGRIQIWDVKTRTRLVALEGHVEQVTSLSFHPGGEFLVSTSWDGGVRLWQPSPGRLLMRLPLSAWVRFSSASQWAGVISQINDQLQLWEVVTSEEYRTFLNPFVSGASILREGAISPDGTLLALGAADGVRLWDIAEGREVAWLRMEATSQALFNSSGRELFTCGPSDGLWRWSIEPNTGPEGGRKIGRPHRVPLPFAPLRMAKSSNDRVLAVVGESAGQSVLLDLASESMQGPAMPHGLVAFVAVTSQAKRIATSGWHSEYLKVWDGQSGKLIKELKTGSLSLVFFTPDDREMIVSRATEFIFHDLNSLEIKRRISRETGFYPGHVAFTADGKLMAMELAPGVIHLIERISGRTVAKLQDPHNDRSTWMGFTPDGTQLVVAARYASAIHRWDLRAIRDRLKPMGLDWDWPAFPAATRVGKAHRRQRMEVVDPMPAMSNQPPVIKTSAKL
jgi:serine/threonine protein kinase/WD40 repeat protein